MRLLIKYSETKGIGKQISQSTFDGSKVTIGRGTDQVVQIPDKRLPLSHCALTLTAGGLELVATGGNRFFYNEQRTKQATLKVGDSVTISGHVLEISEGKDGADFCIEIKIETEKLEKLRDRYTTRLWQLGIPERSLSWILFVGILAIALLIPAAGFFVGMDKLRESPLPDDSQWLSGPIHQTHAFIGDDCTLCHAEAFTQTRDEECMACHAATSHHFDAEKFGVGYGALDECADCHKEHSPSQDITRNDQQSCAVCHEDLMAAGFDSDRLEPATDFYDDHPNFKVSFQKMDADGNWSKQRLNLWEEEAVEQSNLVFPHDVHLDKAGINAADGKVVMACADCHEPELGGLRMKPVTMEQHCSDCHELTFDPDAPDRVVPHGSPPDLMQTLREYYAYEFILKQAGITPSPKKQKVKLDIPQSREARRPGRKQKRKSIADLMIETAMDDSKPVSEQAHKFIEAKVADAADNLFEKQTCTICHEISKTADAEVPWQVLPVKLNAHWLPLSPFSHSGHKNMECESCHEASGSKVATDVLLPDIGSCRTCHGGEQAENLLQSDCLTCHEFHISGQMSMAKPASHVLDFNKQHEALVMDSEQEQGSPKTEPKPDSETSEVQGGKL